MPPGYRPRCAFCPTVPEATANAVAVLPARSTPASITATGTDTGPRCWRIGRAFSWAVRRQAVRSTASAWSAPGGTVPQDDGSGGNECPGGTLLQIDGSRHPRLQERGPRLVLLPAAMAGIIHRYGIPLASHGDRRGGLKFNASPGTSPNRWAQPSSPRPRGGRALNVKRRGPPRGPWLPLPNRPRWSGGLRPGASAGATDLGSGLLLARLRVRARRMDIVAWHLGRG